MAHPEAKHFTVLNANGGLTNRVSAIITHYQGLGVNVRLVLERELIRLRDKLVVSNLFYSDEDETEQSQKKPTLESASYIKAKIQAIEEILSVLNS